MKLKMAENSLFAVLLRSPWWVSFLLVAAISLAAAALAPTPFEWFGLVASLPLLVVGCMAAWRQWRAPSAAAMAAQMQAITAMNWRDFSALLQQTWQAQGANAQAVTGLEADFFVEHQGRSVLVSARRWKAASHGADAIAALVAAMRKRELVAGQYLVAHGNISDAARALAKSEGVELIEGNALAQFLLAKPR